MERQSNYPKIIGAAWAVQAARRYAVVALICLVFSLVYAQFSHGVYSPFMTLLFLIPLLLGAVPALAMYLMNVSRVSLVSRQLWGLSVACFTLASCLQGIFEIAGTGSNWIIAYVFVGACLAAGAVMVFFGKQEKLHRGATRFRSYEEVDA